VINTFKASAFLLAILQALHSLLLDFGTFATLLIYDEHRKGIKLFNLLIERIKSLI
jgi:hypothetical protein